MNRPSKKYASILGILILTAYGVLINIFTNNKLIIMLADVISGLSVVGIAYLFFPIFKKINQKIASGYLALKIFEGLQMIFGGIVILSNQFSYIKDFIYLYPHLYTFIISGFFFYYLLYKSQIIPKFISIWGLIAITTMLVNNAVKLLGFQIQILEMLLVLIITNEVFMSV